MQISKKDIITEIFNICKRRNNFVFDNDLIKEVLVKLKSKTNPYDMTKVDDSTKLPDVLKQNDYYIVHKGNGKHEFIKGINKVFHKFEIIRDDEIINWVYRPSILNDFSTSESSVLSLCYNHRIIHDFLYLDIVANPKIYNSERKNKITFNYFLGSDEFKN